MTIPVYIINFNRLTWPKNLCEQLARLRGIEPILVDNGSTYPPLIDWYEKDCQYKVIRLSENYGQLAPWQHGCVQWYHAHKAFWGSEYYAVTDHDLDISSCPDDLFDVLIDGFRYMPHVVKVGVSLEVADLNDYWKMRVAGWEQQYWERALTDRYWIANVDTTLAVYRAYQNHRDVMTTSPAIRTNRPYTAKHLTWYLDFDKLSDEDRYYFARCNHAITSWRP